MKKLLIFFTVLSTFVFSAIDEYKTDVYFANGILAEKKDARDNAGILRDAIIEKLGINYYNKHIGKVDYAYNRTDGFVIDMLESLVQKLNGTVVAALDRSNIILVLERVGGFLTEAAHTSDLTKQVEKYKTLGSGHKPQIKNKKLYSIK